MIKAVFFDFFNTLGTVEPSLVEMQQHALREFDLQAALPVLSLGLAEADRLWAGEQGRQPLDSRPTVDRERVYATYEQRVLQYAGFAISDETALAIFYRYLQVTGRWALYDDVLSTIEALRAQRMITGVITIIGMGPRNIGGAAVRRLQETMENLGLAPLLDIVVTSDQAGFTKPDPRIFEEAVRRADVAPQEALFVGDQPDSDVVGARSAGLTPLLLDRQGAYNSIMDVPRVATLSEVVEYVQAV